MTNRDHEGTPPFEKTRLCPSPYLYQEGAILCMELQIHPTIQNQSASWLLGSGDDSLSLPRGPLVANKCIHKSWFDIRIKCPG